MNSNSRSGMDDRALFRAVFECALDAMILIDDQGRYVDANPAAAVLLGLPREELLGKRTVDLIAVEFAGGADQLRQRLVSEGRLEGEWKFACATTEGVGLNTDPARTWSLASICQSCAT